MPGDRRQILSLLRLPIPPLQRAEASGYHSAESPCKSGQMGR